MRTDITAAPQMKNASKHAKEGADEVAKRLDIIWDSIGQSEARKIMSEQHKLLAFRPPGDSLAAHAQLAAAKHPVSSDPMPVDILKRVAKVDAERILAQRNPTTADRQSPLLEIDVNMITKGDARLLMSFQHHALGYRPPPDSLAAKAQASIQRKSSSGSAAAEEQPIEETLLREAAYRDASRLNAQLLAVRLRFRYAVSVSVYTTDV
ncbi:hypothetical protein EUX98_g4881 [Antrodiella citrinella]|uniref:Uncharacterized protein n=1 Tax=Antrodiella citrinella TaxID=2447956 RepID=A0A4V3XII6_9APHY|nr:hypothetical protein EUX98_g4881 [Antrodiella citrinella]